MVAEYILIDGRDADEDEIVEALLAEVLKKYDFDESKVNRHPAGSSEGGQFAPKDGELRVSGEKYSSQVDAAVKDFDDYSKYPERPALRLSVGEKGTPDV